MHRTARTAPGTGSVRPRVALLAAVVLVLLAALGIAGPPPGTTGEPVVDTVAAAVRDGAHGPRVGDVCGTVWAGGPRADDGCGTVCVAHGPRVGDVCRTVRAGGPRADDGCGTACVNGPRADDGCGTACANGQRADDACDAVCAVRAAPRQEPYGELPAPRGHLATRAPGTDVTPADSAARLPAPVPHTPSSDPHAPRDRGRAPPATSGI
ncbi:hypothetical protein ABZ250_19905 [Streptomyces afghaniensis]|uniref:hypothetical protein n=1 Tax=Streptomyces afghaniensis TaxID=66865 RepID=UPI0033BAC296